MPILVVDDISVVFGTGRHTVHAVDRVNLEVAEGQFLCLLGPSGCGKSTVLKTIAGLVRPQRGRVAIAGASGDGHPDAVIVWQEPTLIPWRRIKDNVVFGLELRGVRRRERHAAAMAALASLGIAEFADHYPRQLSGGMRQRAGIARALVVDPRILLMDEPFAAVDAQTRRILQEQILSLSQTLRKTVVFVTHSIEEALLLGDRIAVMTARPGRIKAIFDVPFQRPRDPSIRRQPDFQDLEEHIWALLRDEAVRAEMDTGT